MKRKKKTVIRVVMKMNVEGKMERKSKK